MLISRKIAVTGGLASGKSTVCQFLKDKGAYVVSADGIVHALLSSSHLQQEIVNLLGHEILTTGKLDRKKIAQKVFNNLNLLHSFELILHPKINEQIKKKYHSLKEDPSYPLFIVEMPLLFETHIEHFYDVVIAVIANTETCVSRFNKSTGYTKDEFEKRMLRQIDPQLKAQKADIVIENNGTLKELQTVADNLYDQIIKTN